MKNLPAMSKNSLPPCWSLFPGFQSLQCLDGFIRGRTGLAIRLPVSKLSQRRERQLARDRRAVNFLRRYKAIVRTMLHGQFSSSSGPGVSYCDALVQVHLP